ncbi:MAG: acyltransferase [Saprospiraceae bacterium]|nr:acyltransferase [Saprospiraceae bacterium]
MQNIKQDITHRYKALDGLRFLAVLCVIASHNLNSKTVYIFGHLSLDTFFVMSGFLIINILFYLKDKIDIRKLNVGNALKIFYIRRTLRIFPIYYFTLLMIWLFYNKDVNGRMFWHLSYLTNFYVLKVGDWTGELIENYWSLAVEEQFYIIMPLLIFLIPKKYSPVLLIFCVFIALIQRGYVFHMNRNYLESYLMMPACLDAFAMGGFLAYTVNQQLFYIQKWIKSIWFCSFVLVFAVLTAWHEIFDWASIWHIVFQRFSFALLGVYLITYCISDAKDIFHRFLGTPFMVWGGKVSYGMFLFESIVALWTPQDILSQHEILKFMLHAVLSFILASVAQILIERPFNRLKDHFSY